MAIASLVLGICSIVFAVISWGCLWWLSTILGVVGLVLGIIDLKNKKQIGEAPGLAKPGVICSIVGICLSILLLVFIIGLASVASTL